MKIIMTKPIVEEFIKIMAIMAELSMVMVIAVVTIITDSIKAKEDKKALVVA